MSNRCAHVSGVGVLGSFVLWELHDRGVPFTWDDAESPINAWEVSTGGILPPAEQQYDYGLLAQGYRHWREILNQPFAQFVERVRDVRVQLVRPAPKWEALAEISQMRAWLNPSPGLQLNVQEFVTFTRRTFKKARQPHDPSVPGLVLVLCRGVGETVVEARPVPMWGWQCAVDLEAQPGTWLAHGDRVALHFPNPENREPYARLYLQPVAALAHTWWAGTDKRLQRTPALLQELALMRRAQHQRTVERYFGPWLRTVTYRSDIGHGWRPAPRGTTWRDIWFKELRPGLIVGAPFGRSGVQLSPLAAKRIVEHITDTRRRAVV